jgi:hypothetical protein
VETLAASERRIIVVGGCVVVALAARTPPRGSAGVGEAGIASSRRRSHVAAILAFSFALRFSQSKSSLISEADCRSRARERHDRVRGCTE